METLANDLNLLKKFIDNSGDINKKHNSLLYYMIEKDNATSINFLINNNINVNLQNKRNNLKPLHNAILHNSIECVKVLIKNGADVNEISISGYTPLHYAVFNDNEIIIKILIKNGANLNKRDIFGHTPLIIAIDNDYHSSIIALKNSKSIISKYNFINFFNKNNNIYSLKI
jgi:ankyrin repeat protein